MWTFSFFLPVKPVKNQINYMLCGIYTIPSTCSYCLSPQNTYRYMNNTYMYVHVSKCVHVVTCVFLNTTGHKINYYMWISNSWIIIFLKNNNSHFLMVRKSYALPLFSSMPYNVLNACISNPYISSVILTVHICMYMLFNTTGHKINYYVWIPNSWIMIFLKKSNSRFECT